MWMSWGVDKEAALNLDGGDKENITAQQKHCVLIH